ncbi:MAG: nitroreductase family protein [Firmicutes bacterium]|nr:nitroreductase family protein [Bacillota bacterium]
MDVFTAIKKRRSIRRFKSNPLSDEIIFKLLDAARHAPTAGNVQPWKFFVVRDKDMQSKLAKAALGQTWMTTAPVIVVVCADLVRSGASYGRRGAELYALQDTAAATQNMILCAVGEGIACCWVGAFREKAAAEALGINLQVLRPVAMVPLGYPAESPAKAQKLSLEEITDFI